MNPELRERSGSYSTRRKTEAMVWMTLLRREEGLGQNPKSIKILKKPKTKSQSQGREQPEQTEKKMA